MIIINPYWNIAAGGRVAVSPLKKVMIFCYFMGHRDQYRMIAEKFGLSPSTCHAIVMQICRIVNEYLMQKYVVWPNAHRQEEISQWYLMERGFPGISELSKTNMLHCHW